MQTVSHNSGIFSSIHYYQGASYVMSEDKNTNEGFSKFMNSLNLYFVSRHIAYKLNKINQTLLPKVEEEIKTKSAEELIETHQFIKSCLDLIHSKKFRTRNSNTNINHPSWLIKPLIKPVMEFIDVMKQVELKYRISAYPERNQIVLTYDEMRELSELTKGWEPAEEQSTLSF
jgi:hypothetical protein